MSKISGPLLDRIDLHIEVRPVPFETLAAERVEETSEIVRSRVRACRSIQEERFADHPGIHSNSQMGTKLVRQMARLDSKGRGILHDAVDRLGFTARAFEKILKVSRTIADLEGAQGVKPEHVAEAIQYRALDRKMLDYV